MTFRYSWLISTTMSRPAFQRGTSSSELKLNSIQLLRGAGLGYGQSQGRDSIGSQLSPTMSHQQYNALLIPDSIIPSSELILSEDIFWFRYNIFQVIFCQYHEHMEFMLDCIGACADSLANSDIIQVHDGLCRQLDEQYLSYYIREE